MLPSLIIGLLFGFIFELPFLLISLHTPKLSSGLIFGFIFGLIAMLKYGGAACIQHFTLRRMLYKKSRIPWNYAKFLDFASKRLLMKKIGGGYIFFHRMLLEHFANMDSN